MKRLFFVSIVALIIAATACGSGSDGGEKSNITAGFTPDEPSPGANTVAAAEGASSNDLVTVHVNVTDTNNVYAAAFDLSYESASVTYVGRSAGTLLEQGGHSVYYEVQEPQPGQLLVVATRQGDVPGANAVGTVPVVALTFRVEEEGSTALGFQAASLFDDQDPQPQPIAGITWFGGTLDGLP
jgi:hypothetical protein